MVVQTDFWSQFQRPGNEEIQTEEPSQQLQQEPIQEKEQFQWGNFQTPDTYQGPEDPTADEGTFEYITRNILSNSSRMLEGLAGKYGNVEKFSKDALSNNPALGGVLGWGLSELLGKDRWEKLVRGQKGSEQMFPTSEKLKEASYDLSKGYTKPKTSGEESFHEFSTDVGSLGGTPSPINVSRGPAAQMAVNKLLIPAAANATKHVVKELGFGEDKANLAKMAIWLPLSLAGNVNANQQASNLMNQGRNGIPANVNVNVPRFQQRLQQIANDPHLLHSDPRTALARQQLNGLNQDLANGQTSVRSMMTAYDGLNAAKRSRGMFEMTRGDQNFARRAIDTVRNGLREEIMQSGAAYPEAINNWRNGIGAWAAIHQSNQIKQFTERLAKGPYAKIMAGPAAALFTGGVGAASHLLPHQTLGAAAVVPSLYKTGQVLYRMWNNPTLANYYWNAIGAAQAENAPAFIKNYQKLNDNLKDHSTKSKKQKVK